jgi:hypothetical protein
MFWQASIGLSQLRQKSSRGFSIVVHGTTTTFPASQVSPPVLNLVV